MSYPDDPQVPTFIATFTPGTKLSFLPLDVKRLGDYREHDDVTIAVKNSKSHE
jgi:hypothetical protein